MAYVWRIPNDTRTRHPADRWPGRPLTQPHGPMPPLACQKSAFSLDPGIHYINCAYLSPLARVVEEAGIAGIRAKCAPSGITPADFFDPCDELRRRFGRLVNAPADGIAIVPAASYGVATCARNIDLSRGANIVLTARQFPGNVHAWRRLARERGAEIRMVDARPGPGCGERWSTRIIEAIDAGTEVVTMGVIHWTDGTVFDIEAIAARAREVGAYLIIDGTQSVGAMDFDVARIRPDALVCSGYKWLMGPYSIGVAYFGPRLLGGVPLEETWIGREGSRDFAGLAGNYPDGYEPGAIRYDVGERSNFILVPMMNAALQLVLEWTPARIAEYCGTLTSGLVERARNAGFGVEETPWRAPHLFGLHAPPGLDPRLVTQALAARNVHVSLRGSALRISPHVYNDEADVDALWDALESVLPS